MSSIEITGVWVLVILSSPYISSAAVSPVFYEKTCPQALKIIRQVVKAAVKNEPRIGASLLRVHFHDCFVQGCDGSLLLDKTSTIDSEKFSSANNMSIRGFDVIDRIKAAVDKACPGPVVSCADIVAVAARDSVVELGGPSWKVLLGRRDSTTASRTLADADIPAPFMELDQLIQNFKKQGLDKTDLVALSGGHTIGFAQCRNFRNKIYNDTNINSGYAASLRAICPANGGDSNLASLDFTSAKFDSNYYKKIMGKKGLLHSDQALEDKESTHKLVNLFRNNYDAFAKAFARSMVKMGNIKPLTGTAGQIRKNCRVVNAN